VIYVVKVRDEAEGECTLGSSHDLVSLTLADDLPPTYSYQLTLHLSYAPSHVTSLALIKRAPR